MEFTEFVNRLYPIISGERAKDVFTQELFLSITSIENDDNFIAETGLSTFRSYYSGDRSINRFSKKIRKYLEPSCFEEYINTLSDEQCSQLCSTFSDVISNITAYNVGEKLSELFVEIINDASTKIGNSSKKKERSNITNEQNDICNMDNISENTKDAARRFCIDHEQEKELFVLCQIAFNLNPAHKHERELYTDYNKCSHDVRNAIMIMNDIPILNFEDEWEYKYLDIFREDIRKQKLCSDRDLLYEGGKYLHRAMHYPSERIQYIHKYTYPTLILNHKIDRMGSLVCFIDEYIHNNLNLTLEYNGDPPLEWMINAFNMENTSDCPDNLLAIWLNMFVLSACYVIPINYEKKNPNDIIFLTPSLDNIETLEDLYYAALLNLHSIYC